MSFNGSGTFVINSAGQPVVANTVISATTFNALTADLANGLSTCITKDGQTTPTANIPMGGFKITNLATGTAATDAATVAQIQSNGAALVTVTGTDTLVGTLTPALTTYVTGAVYYFIAPATNTGAVTLNIDTLGAKAVTRDGTTALVAGDITSGEMVAVVYDGTRFQLISPVNSFTNLNVSSTLTVAGATTLNGNLQVGNAGADTVNFQASGWTLTNNVSVTGTWADIGTITTADINGGTIDGTTIGGGTAAAGTFTTVGATTGNITTVNATTVDSTNLEVTNLKAKDGTAAGSIADSTGVVTLNSVVATTADINGGTIDATTIGGSSPAVGNFTTVSAASAVFTTATITTVNTTTLDLTNLEVTNIKAKDGTASMVIDGATGKVNATTVSAASMNAGVAAVTTLTATGASVASANLGVAVVTNLTATGASVASMNAGVALLTNATVTTLTASGASIASANIGNLQFTAASIASINAGVAVITNLTATGASIASANVGTAVITAATVTGASIASMNAGVALLTTATVTNLTATGASIASANVGTLALTRLDVTAASVASANAGVAVITTGTVTDLTATSASIASMNAGVALLTTATVTNLTATGASIASANAGNLQVTGASVASANVGVALITTGTITNLTATGASVASANVGTAVVTGLTVTNASIASLNAGTATITTGNLTFSSTAQRITGDFSNATQSNRVMFQSSTTNGATGVGILPNGTSTTALLRTYSNSDPTNASTTEVIAIPTESRFTAGITGTGTYQPMTFYTGGSERARIETDGDIGIGTSTLVSGVRLTVLGGGTQLSPGTTAQEGVRIQRATGYATLTGINNDNNAYNGLQLFTGASAAVTVDTSSNVGIGTTSPNKSSSSTALTVNTGTAGNYSAVEWASGDTLNYHINANNSAIYHVAAGTRPWIVYTNGSEQMRIDGSTGNVGIGGTANGASRLEVAGTYASNGGFTNGISSAATIPSTTTTTCLVFKSEPSTQAASFTLTNLYHYSASQGTKGSGSTITSQIGFLAESTLTGATNNYGFYSNIASGSNRWNFYAAGTAENYVANNLKIGGTAARATTAGTAQLVLFDGTAPAGTLANGVSFYSAAGEANVMDAAGNATLLSPHDSETNEWIFRSKHTPTGKVLKIDVEKMLRFINEHFGLDMVHEFTE